MAEIRSLEAARKKKAKTKAAGKTLCRSGHHKWKVDKNTVFDSKSGRLVTKMVCDRCGEVKIKAT